MERIERSRLYHRLISALKFSNRKVHGNITDAQIYEFVDIVCDEICSRSIMVVGCEMPGFGAGVSGKFGVEEPWPSWVDVNGLARDFPPAPVSSEKSDGARVGLASTDT